MNKMLDEQESELHKRVEELLLENTRLKKELAKLRAAKQAADSDRMSSKLREALRE